MEDLDSTIQGLMKLERLVEAYFVNRSRPPNLYAFLSYFPVRLFQDLKNRGVGHIIDSLRESIVGHLHCYSTNILYMSASLWDSPFFAEEFPEVLPSMLQKRPIEVHPKKFLKNYQKYLTMTHNYQ